MTMDTRLHKGMLTALRRAPKAAAPIVRHGVTRAGQVGVEFEHQGVKAWGRNETAARASWQVSNVGKRYQDGSGTAVGRRHVEKAAATATPARRPAQQMAKTGAQQSRRALVRSNAMPSIEAAPDPMQTTQQPVAKADRYFDPEDKRQRRLGAYGAGGALTGGAIAYSGGRAIAADSKHARELPHDFARPRASGKFVKVPNRVAQNRAVTFVRTAGAKANRPLLVRPSHAGRVGAGAALVAGSVALVRRGGDPRRRRWQ